mgnify:FL=1
MLLHGFYEVGCLYKAFVCTGIQPCEALAQKLNVQLSFLKVDTVQVCDLKLASCAWLQILCVLYDLVVVEVETGYTVVALWLSGFSSMETAFPFWSNSTMPKRSGSST